MESGSDSGPSKAENRGRPKEHLNTSTQRPKAIPAKSSFSSLAAVKPRSAAETTSKNMTVETETVTSIPQAAIGGPPGERVAQGRGDPSGSLRLKPSNETIRPKKDRKKATRKAPSINAGTGMSFFTHNPYHHHQHPRARTDFRPRSDTIPSVSSSSSTVEFPQQYAISISSSHEMAMRKPSMQSPSFFISIHLLMQARVKLRRKQTSSKLRWQVLLMKRIRQTLTKHSCTNPIHRTLHHIGIDIIRGHQA